MHQTQQCELIMLIEWEDFDLRRWLGHRTTRGRLLISCDCLHSHTVHHFCHFISGDHDPSADRHHDPRGGTFLMLPSSNAII